MRYKHSLHLLFCLAILNTSCSEESSDTTDGTTGATVEELSSDTSTNTQACEVFENSDTFLQQTSRPGFHLVVNGIATTSFPATVLLVSSEGSICTGTFVSSSTLITASHCIDPKKTSGGMRMVSTSEVSSDGLTAAYESGKEAKKVLQSGPTANGESKEVKSGEMDLAVLIFADGTAPDSVKIKTDKIVSGDTATIVGYGNRYLDDNKETSTDVLKRYGESTAIADATGSCQGLFGSGRSDHASPTTVQKDVLTGSGDSGGPAYIGGKLAAITSSSGAYTETPSKGTAYYVNLQSDFAKAFLVQAKAAGATIDE